MNKKSTLFEKINLELYYSKSDTTEVMMHKVKQYLSDTKQNNTQIFVQNEPIKQIQNIFKVIFDSDKGMHLIETK